MPHLALYRALAGGAGLAGCIALLADQARADVIEFVPQPPAALAAPSAPVARTARSAPVAPNLFGTVALPARAPRYSTGWRRAGLDASALPSMQRLVAPARGLSREQQIAYVQGAVDRRIRSTSDAAEWGLPDYWASAAETLRHRAGDSEDRAIVKMQALRSLGFPARDLYLTIGRGKAGRGKAGEPVTALVVRFGPYFYVLHDQGGSPGPAERRQDFEPLLTLGQNAAWIHGHKVASAGGGGPVTDSPR